VLYLTGGLFGCWWLGKLNPSRAGEAPGFWAIFGLSLFAGILVAYGLPLITYFAPRIVRLYPSYLVTSRGLSFHYFRFGLISMYNLEQREDFWILRLFDLDAKQTLVVLIPTQNIKTKLELALNAGGVTENVLAPAAVSSRREADQTFALQMDSYRKNAQQYDKSSAFWFIGILFLGGVASFALAHYFPTSTAAPLAEVIILFGVIGGYFFTIIRHKKRLAIANGLNCPHCGQLAINQLFMRTLECTHTCAYCGEPYDSLGN
jgi:hypothetical protein